MNNRIFGLKLKILNLGTIQSQKRKNTPIVHCLSEDKFFVPTSSHTSVPSAELVSTEPQVILGCHNCIVGTTLFPEATGREGMDSAPSVLFTYHPYPLNKIFFRPGPSFSYVLVCVLLSYGSL